MHKDNPMLKLKDNSMIITKTEAKDCNIDKAFKWSHKYFKEKNENKKSTTKPPNEVVLTNVDLEILEPVADIVSLYFEITKEQLLGKRRKAEFVLPRQIFSYIVRNNFLAIGYNDRQYQISKIAKYLNGHHTTVLHSLGTISNFREKNTLKVNNKIDFILQKMEEDERLKKSKK